MLGLYASRGRQVTSNKNVCSRGDRLIAAFQQLGLNPYLYKAKLPNPYKRQATQLLTLTQ